MMKAAIQRELEALRKAEGLTAIGTSSWVHGIVQMVNRAIEPLDLIEDAQEIADLYRQAESAYLLAADKVAVEDSETSDTLRLFSTVWLTRAHQYERYAGIGGGVR